jgi:hypothetical protein
LWINRRFWQFFILTHGTQDTITRCACLRSQRAWGSCRYAGDETINFSAETRGS